MNTLGKAFPALLGGFTRAVGMVGGTAGAMTAEDTLTQAISAFIAASMVLWQAIREIRDQQKRDRKSE